MTKRDGATVASSLARRLPSAIAIGPLSYSAPARVPMRRGRGRGDKGSMLQRASVRSAPSPRPPSSPSAKAREPAAKSASLAKSSPRPRAANRAAAGTADEPALRFSSDADAGFSRRRRGSGFSYLDAQGAVLRDATVLRRIRALVIPPAWQDVWVCTQANGHLQATGRDARGRKQYLYHPQWSEQRAGSKYAQLREFAQALPRIRRRVEAQLAGAATPTRERVLATIVRLLDTTWLRIGNQRYRRDNGSHGLSTLRRRHAVVEGAQLRLSFRGKSGVRHEVAISDRRIARVVGRCQELPGQELFCHVDADGEVRGIDSGDVNAWLAEAAGRAITAKDFRTWHGSVLALQGVLKGCAAVARAVDSVRQPQPSQRLSARGIVDEVARQLGNTPAVCRKAYIHPSVLALCDTLADGTRSAALLEQPWARRPGAASGLKVAERRLLALLQGGERRRAREG